MDNIREKLVELLEERTGCTYGGSYGDVIIEEEIEISDEEITRIADHLIAHGVTVQDAEQEKGEWNWKHRHRGGFRKYTGEDAFGEKYTITVDERFECYDPYCPACGKLNEAIYLNFCPNCGKAMLPSNPPFVRQKPPKGE